MDARGGREARGDAGALTPFQRSLDLRRVYVKGSLPKGAAASSRLRLLTWNIERGAKPDAVADVLVRLQPDIACLQEVDWGNARSGGRDVLAELAQRTGMLGLFGVEFLEVASPARAANLAGGGATGNAILTNRAPLAAAHVVLPAPFDWEHDAANDVLPERVRRAIAREPRIGGRFALSATFEAGASRLAVASVHFEDKFGGVRARWFQFEAAVAALAPSSGPAMPCVVAGDFNTFDSPLARVATPDSDGDAFGKPRRMPEARWWRSHLLPSTPYRDPFRTRDWTFRVWPFFRAKLDWIATSGAAVEACGIGPLASSDHRPLWADLVV